MKKINLILLIFVAIFFAACSKVPQDLSTAQISEQDTNSQDSNQEVLIKRDIINSQSVFEFEGYAVGKSHIGHFDVYQGELYVDEQGNVVKGSGLIEISSINTGIENLDSHLKSDDFFDVENYPYINIELVKIEDSNAVANVEFKGVTNQVMFPVNQEENKISAEFLLDTTPYNFKYIGVNEDVRIKFEFVY